MGTSRLAKVRAAFHHLRWWHWTLVAVGALWLTALLVRQPLTRFATHRALGAIPGWQTDAADAHISFGVLRNAFVVGLSESLQKLPPPTPDTPTSASVTHP